MKNYFSYEVDYFDGCEEDNERETFIGVTYGDSYQEALTNILDFYGEQNVISVRLEEWNAEGCLEISRSALEDMREHLI